MKSETGPEYQGQGETHEGGRFNERGDSLMRPVFHGRKVGRSPSLATRILNIYAGTLMGLSHVHSRVVSTTHWSLDAVSLKMTLALGIVDRTYTPRTADG